jgi:DNA-binding protein H-NS
MMAKRGRPVSRKTTVKAVAKKAPGRSAAASPDAGRLISALEGLTTADLRKVIQHAQALVDQKTEGERRSLIAEMTTRAKDLGMSVADILGKAVPTAMRSSRLGAKKKAAPAKKGSAPVKYRGPGGETWAGRGRPPRWLSALEAEGKKREDFAV